MSETNNGRDPPETPWGWTPEGLERWIEYKRSKAHAFIDRGYSVEWTTDAERWMAIYIPQQHQRREPELRATAKIFEEPSKFGVDNGRISKLTIQTRDVNLLRLVARKSHESVVTLFNYDRGHDVDRLKPGTTAHELYRDVLDILN